MEELCFFYLCSMWFALQWSGKFQLFFLVQSSTLFLLGSCRDHCPKCCWYFVQSYSSLVFFFSLLLLFICFYYLGELVSVIKSITAIIGRSHSWIQGKRINGCISLQHFESRRVFSWLLYKVWFIVLCNVSSQNAISFVVSFHHNFLTPGFKFYVQPTYPNNQRAYIIGKIRWASGSKGIEFSFL